MPDRIEDWQMVTWTGVVFDLLSPKAEDVRIIDLVWGASNICRFGGHSDFYSCLAHCMFVSALLPDHLKLEGLVHDLHESYCGDCINPMKRAMRKLDEDAMGPGSGMSGYDHIEYRIERVVRESLGLPKWEDVPKADQTLIKDADYLAYHIESWALRPFYKGQLLASDAAKPASFDGRTAPMPPRMSRRLTRGLAMNTLRILAPHLGPRMDAENAALVQRSHEEIERTAQSEET